ncbi:MAG: TlpA family protein disulfide reductase [Actinomycetota bacterium]|nr:TlpA family protein disulfide reductase [Actinomycetota bacterium]
MTDVATTPDRTAAPAEASGTAAPRRRTALYTTIGVGVVAVLLVAVLATRPPATTRLAGSPLLGRTAPALSGESLLAGGGDFDLAEERGRWVLVNFFATWCVPCQAEHPDLVRFEAAHAEAGDARVVSVVFSDDPDDVARFFSQRGGDWPVLADPVGSTALEFGVTGVPESYLIAPDGTLVSKIIGGVDDERLEDLLARAKGSSEPGEPS